MALLDWLAVLTNIDTREIDIPTVLCSLCEDVPECLNHILIACLKVYLIWHKCLSWWAVKFPNGVEWISLML